MAGYLPNNDAELVDWADRFSVYITTHAAQFGLTPADLDELGVARPAFSSALTNMLAAQAHASSLVGDKKMKRGTLEQVIRGLVARVKAHPAATEVDLRAMGIITSTPGETGPVGLDSSTDKPTAVIDISGRQKHVLRIQNQTLTGITRAKPQGAIGCEIWRKVGDPPSGEGDIVYVGLATRSPYVVEYSAEEAGKTAHYMMRWVSSGGIKGTWSEAEPATIAA